MPTAKPHAHTHFVCITDDPECLSIFIWLDTGIFKTNAFALESNETADKLKITVATCFFFVVIYFRCNNYLLFGFQLDMFGVRRGFQRTEIVFSSFVTVVASNGFSFVWVERLPIENLSIHVFQLQMHRQNLLYCNRMYFFFFSKCCKY